jgi:cytoplasmic tRNA 2-thiolation protein 1
MLRTLIKDLERERPQAILDLIYSGDSLSVKDDVKKADEKRCERCGYITSQRLCKACLLLYGLNNDDTAVGIAAVSLFLLGTSIKLFIFRDEFFRMTKLKHI